MSAPSPATTTHRPPTQKTARDLMTPDPVSISGQATVDEVVAFLTDTGYSAAPVRDETGRPVGVVSRTDVVVHLCARAAAAEEMPGYYTRPVLTAGYAETARALKGPAVARARDLMTPMIYSVEPHTPVGQVAAQMADRNVHRLFVVDDKGVLIGVVSALDLLRHFATAG